MPAKVTNHRTTSLLGVFALIDCCLKFVINCIEGQNAGLAFLNAFVSSVTCFSVIFVLIVATGRTHLLLFCGLYYVSVFLVFALMGLSSGASIDHGATPMLRGGRWTLGGITALAIEVAGSMAVSFVVLAVLLFVYPRLRSDRPASS